MKYLSPIFPIGADLVRISRNFESIDHRKSELVLIYRFLGFVQRIHRERDDINVFLPESFYL